MKVYALRSNFNGIAETYEYVIDLYMNYDDALMAQIVLEQANTEPDQSYYVHEMSVK
jgi:hypothetical protein